MDDAIVLRLFTNLPGLACSHVLCNQGDVAREGGAGHTFQNGRQVTDETFAQQVLQDALWSADGCV